MTTHVLNSLVLKYFLMRIVHLIVKWHLNLLSVLIHIGAVLLCGDFNYRHPLFGSEGSTIGMDTSDPMNLLYRLEKIHFPGDK